MTGTDGRNEVDVSVIIPVYEQPQLLREALESVSEQSYEPFEIVVVDDASVADISSVVSDFPGARLVRHQTNLGAGAARNTGVEAANGTYLAFLDADDIWEESKLKKQRRVFDEGENNLGLVYTGFVQYEVDGSEWIRHPNAAGDIYLQELERDRIHPTSTVLIRRSAFEDVGGFDTTLPSRQDYDLWIRITEKYSVDYVDEVLVDKREQPDSISKDFDSRIAGDLAVFRKVKMRAKDLGFITRSRIHSYHHHVIGRDYESNGNRRKALKHFCLAVLRYPFRPISWAMFVITLLGIDRNGALVTRGKQFIR